MFTKVSQLAGKLVHLKERRQCIDDVVSSWTSTQLVSLHRERLEVTAQEHLEEQDSVDVDSVAGASVASTAVPGYMEGQVGLRRKRRRACEVSLLQNVATKPGCPHTGPVAVFLALDFAASRHAIAVFRRKIKADVARVAALIGESQTALLGTRQQQRDAEEAAKRVRWLRGSRGSPCLTARCHSQRGPRELQINKKRRHAAAAAWQQYVQTIDAMCSQAIEHVVLLAFSRLFSAMTPPVLRPAGIESELEAPSTDSDEVDSAISSVQILKHCSPARDYATATDFDDLGIDDDRVQGRVELVTDTFERLHRNNVQVVEGEWPQGSVRPVIAVRLVFNQVGAELVPQCCSCGVLNTVQLPVGCRRSNFRA